jgi:hypothetical protein
MADAAGADVTSVDEQLLRAVRGMSATALRTLLTELLALAREPHCAESQADGVPCPTAHNACDQCYRYEEFRQRLREGLLREQAAGGPLRPSRELVDLSSE